MRGLLLKVVGFEWFFVGFQRFDDADIKPRVSPVKKTKGCRI